MSERAAASLRPERSRDTARCRTRDRLAEKNNEYNRNLRDAERSIKELQFVNKKLTQELVASQQAAQEGAARAR